VIFFCQKLDWSSAIERLQQLGGAPNFFTNQTVTHLAMHSNGRRPLDPAKFVLQLTINFSLPTATPMTASSCAITSIPSATSSGNRSFRESRRLPLSHSCAFNDSGSSLGHAAWRRPHFHGIVARMGSGRARRFALLFRGRVSGGNFIASGFSLETVAFPAKAAAFVRNNATRFDVIDCIVGALPVRKNV